MSTGVLSRPTYDSFDREGGSVTVRYLRIGRDGGSRVEIGERGFYLRLGRAEITFRLRWRGEVDDA
jgi:hypothetical protein